MSSSLSLFKAGDRYEHGMVVTPGVMDDFMALSGDENPMHRDAGFAMAHGFKGKIVYGNLFGAMVSTLVGMKLPSKEVVIARQTLEFRNPAYVGDEVKLEATVANVAEAVQSVQFKLQFTANTEVLCTGQLLIRCL
ncbi:MAG: MaoC family dehydratase N-terminal domain-containing protein [Xanthobacteraceae bacterium]|nr:MaoC family dehydratase N-terminal domain-containing protein [Xanthobacteraceae bacterium]